MNSPESLILTRQSSSAHLAQPLRIVSAGLCCAVGYHLRAAGCAIRANMDHFQASDFLTESGESVSTARLPDQDCWGTERIARWITYSIEDCLRDLTDIDPLRMALLLLAPEAERPGVEQTDYVQMVELTARTLGIRFHSSSCILPLGKAGLGQALQYAASLLAVKEIEAVLLCGGDSFLNAATVEHYLDQQRLLVPGNRDGFLPGEAAATLCLESAHPHRRGMHVVGVGRALEAAHPLTEAPNRAQALTHAVRSACTAAGIGPRDLDFRLSDQNGEIFFSKEGSVAFTRLMLAGPDVLHLTLADKLGEIGAASGVAALAYLHHVMSRSDCSPGHTGVVHLSNDDGLRSAVVVRWYE